MDMNKFTRKSIEAISDTQSIAREYGNQRIEPVHLLFALIKKPDGLVSNLLEKSGISVDDAARECESVISALPKVSGGELYASGELNAVLGEAESAGGAGGC